MHKMERLENDIWIRFVHQRSYILEKTTGPDRLRVGIPAQSDEPVRLLLAMMPEPFVLVYVLHTPRGAERGRYESPGLNRAQVEAFLHEFHAYLTEDARHDLWILSPAAHITLVWDRHDILFAYGPLTSFISSLEDAGYLPDAPSIPIPHAHLYHAEFDRQQYALLETFDWYRTALRPSDRQLQDTTP